MAALTSSLTNPLQLVSSAIQTRSAASPATWGAANEVPLPVAYPLLL